MKPPAAAIAPAIALVLGLGCTGCAATPGTGSGSAAVPESEALCKADALPPFIEQTASAETGAAILKASGARTLRWAGPGMAVTMDYRPDRVTVSYDENMAITRASCG